MDVRPSTPPGAVDALVNPASATWIPIAANFRGMTCASNNAQVHVVDAKVEAVMEEAASACQESVSAPDSVCLASKLHPAAIAMQTA